MMWRVDTGQVFWRDDKQPSDPIHEAYDTEAAAEDRLAAIVTGVRNPSSFRGVVWDDGMPLEGASEVTGRDLAAEQAPGDHLGYQDREAS